MEEARHAWVAELKESVGRRHAKLGGAPAGVVGAEMSAWAGMTIEEYDEQLFAEVEAEIGAAPDSDEELAALEAELAALDDDMQLGAAQDAGHEVTFDGAEATRETRWVRKDGQFQQLGLQEAIEQELENEIEEERRVEAQREDSEDEEIRALKGEVAALEREVAAQANEADQEVLAKIKAGLAMIQAYEKAARTNGTQAERAAEEIVNGAAREASRILAEEHAATLASVSESSGPASELAAELGNSNRPVLDDNIAPWMREMQQLEQSIAAERSNKASMQSKAPASPASPGRPSSMKKMRRVDKPAPQPEPEPEHSAPELKPVRKEVVRVKVIRCSNLIGADKGGKSSDPYVTLYLDDAQKQQTSRRDKTLNPEFNQECSFALTADSKELRVICADFDRVGSDDFIGELVVDLAEMAAKSQACFGPETFSFGDPNGQMQKSERKQLDKRKAAGDPNPFGTIELAFEFEAAGTSSSDAGPSEGVPHLAGTNPFDTPPPGPDDSSRLTALGEPLSSPLSSVPAPEQQKLRSSSASGEQLDTMTEGLEAASSWVGVSYPAQRAEVLLDGVHQTGSVAVSAECIRLLLRASARSTDGSDQEKEIRWQDVRSWAVTPKKCEDGPSGSRAVAQIDLNLLSGPAVIITPLGLEVESTQNDTSERKRDRWADATRLAQEMAVASAQARKRRGGLRSEDRTADAVEEAEPPDAPPAANPTPSAAVQLCGDGAGDSVVKQTHRQDGHTQLAEAHPSPSVERSGALDVAPEFLQRLNLLAEYEADLKALLQASTEYGAIQAAELPQSQHTDVVSFVAAAKNAAVELQSYQEAMLHLAGWTPSQLASAPSKLLALVPQAERARRDLAKTKRAAVR